MTVNYKATTFSTRIGGFQTVKSMIDFRRGASDMEIVLQLVKETLEKSSQGLEGRLYLSDGPEIGAYAAGDDVVVTIDGKEVAKRGHLKENQVLEASIPQQVGRARAEYHKPLGKEK